MINRRTTGNERIKTKGNRLLISKTKTEEKFVNKHLESISMFYSSSSTSLLSGACKLLTPGLDNTRLFMSLSAGAGT